MFGAKKAILRVSESFQQKADGYVEIARGFPTGTQERAFAFLKAAVMKDVAELLAREAGETSDVIDVGTGG